MFNIFLYSLTFSFIALGALYSERVGILNIAIEGFAFLSVFLTSFLIYFGYNPIFSTFIVLFINFLLTLFLLIFIIKEFNIFIVGIAVNMLLYFLVYLFMRSHFDLISGFNLNIKDHTYYMYFFILLFVLFFIFSIYIFNFSKLRIGFELIRSNSNKEILGESKTIFLKFIAILISVLASGIAGSFLAINLNVYSYNLGINNGWLAICMLYISFSNPILIPIVSFLIVLLEYHFFGLQDYINSYFALSFTFYFAILINFFVSLFKNSKKSIS